MTTVPEDEQLARMLADLDTIDPPPGWVERATRRFQMATIPTIIRTDDDAWMLMAPVTCDRLDAQRIVDAMIDDPRKRDRNAPVVRLEDRPPPGLVWQARPDCSIPALRDGGAYAREQQQLALTHVDALAQELDIRVIDLRTASPRGSL